MDAREDHIYREALALWQAVSDKPAPEGDASTLMQAAIAVTTAKTYERLRSPLLRDRVMAWAVYKDAPPHLA